MKDRFISACGRMKPGTPNALRVGAVFFILIELFCIVVSCCCLHRFAGKPLSAEGVLTAAGSVPEGRSFQYCVYIDGVEYEIDNNFFSRRRYGIPEDMPFKEFVSAMDSHIGEYCRVEYMPLAPESRKIVRLVAGTTPLVSKADALRDYRGAQLTTCVISVVMLIATISCCAAVRYGIRRANEIE